MGRVRIRLLGEFGIDRDDVPVDAREWRLRKARTLVKVLALAPGQRLHRDVLLELLWPAFEDWAAERRNELRRLLCELLVDLADGAALQRALDIDPLHERAVRGLMRHLAASGRRSEALARYERLRDDLGEAYGSDPDPESRRLYRDLLSGDGETRPAVRAPFPRLPGPAGAGRAGRTAVPARGVWNYFRSAFFSDLDPAPLVEAHSRVPNAMSELHIHHLGGAMGRVPADATAFGTRDRTFLLNVVARSADSAGYPSAVEWARASARAVGPDAAAYVNFTGEGSAYPKDTYERLVAVKDRYDPTNLFRLNQNIPPSALP
jgi:hypothetical protein